MNITTHYYLGANTPEGFYSLYDQYLTENDRLYIIKGSPGSGKSTFMKRLAEKISKTGTETELIHCSGDPDSLDGVYFPELHIAYVDGTAPHVIEPDYAGVRENYINFGEFLDMDALWKNIGEIREVNAKYKAEYVKAYNALAAAKVSQMGVLDELNDDNVKSVVMKKAKRLARKEFKNQKGSAVVKERFTDAFTCKGMVHRYDTIADLAERIYLIDSAFGLNHIFLEIVAAEAIGNNWDVILCRDTLYPDTISHIIAPQASLAIVSRYGSSFPNWQARTIHLDSIPSRSSIKDMRDVIKRRKRIWDDLTDESYGYLTRAKAYHDQLEAIYRPHVDFYAVDKLTEKHLEMLAKMN